MLRSPKSQYNDCRYEIFGRGQRGCLKRKHVNQQKFRMLTALLESTQLIVKQIM